MKLDYWIMFGSHNDEVISPWSSAWFNFWGENDEEVV